ncbi:MAG: GTP-binding protein [Planctomycetota bacterium]
MSPTPSPIPCHIVAGPLGVGKTTAILNYLREHAGHQRVGVLVNDFGPVGLDSTTLQAEAPQTQVLNVPGGCICCTMLAELPNCIKRLTQDPDQPVDRLIIEPSGMATPAQVIDLLRGAQAELNLTLHPSIVLLSTPDFDEEMFERMPYFHMFSEAADILVFNRCDQTNDAKIDRAKRWAEQLDPPKLRVVTTTHGQLPAEVFRRSQEPPAQKAGGCESASDHHHHDHHDGHHHHHHHHHDHDGDEHHHHHDHDPTIHPGGFILDADRQFDEQTLLVNLMRIGQQGIGDNQVLRLKGVFHTSTGWQSLEIANGEISFRRSAHRRDNRMEWITKPTVVGQADMLAELDRPVNWQEVADLANAH